LLGATLALAFAGCQHDAPPEPRTTAQHKGDYPDHPTDNPAITVAPTTQESHAFTGISGDEIGDDYVYYPTWEVYYGRARREYVYFDGKAWVRTTKPDPAWSSNIQGAPSVPMTFHDAPERHHAEVVRVYPRTWRPEAAGQPARTANDDLPKSSTN
jgi:hypothetical protein